MNGIAIADALIGEASTVPNPFGDLLGEATDGSLIHIELQSTNDPKIAIRMAECATRIYRRFGRFPRQILVYLGDGPMQMSPGLKAGGLESEYEIVDFRDINGEGLLSSVGIGDNVLAILARLRDRKIAIREILGKISSLAPGEQATYLRALLTLAGLRAMEEVVEEEAKKVPVLNDILEHKVLGREYKRGLKDEASRLLHRLIEKRFGPFPAWAEERLAGRSVTELEDLSVRVLDAKSIEELLQ